MALADRLSGLAFLVNRWEMFFFLFNIEVGSWRIPLKNPSQEVGKEPEQICSFRRDSS